MVKFKENKWNSNKVNDDADIVIHPGANNIVVRRSALIDTFCFDSRRFFFVPCAVHSKHDFYHVFFRVSHQQKTNIVNNLFCLIEKDIPHQNSSQPTDDNKTNMESHLSAWMYELVNQKSKRNRTVE
jgi:hypothetical protein